MVTRRRVLIAAIAAVTMLAGSQFMGCSSSSSLPTQPAVTDQALTTSSDVVLLQRDVAAKGVRGLLKSFYDEELITPQSGGTLNVGNIFTGFTTLSFPPGAVTKPVTITVKLNGLGPVMVECEPSGLQFNKPATLTLSYKGAILGKLIELAAKNGRYDALAIYVHGDDIGLLSNKGWARVDGSVWNPTTQSVSAPIWHFSRYAIGSNG